MTTTPPQKRGPGRNRLLTHDQVARAAFDLVDAEGAAALTMPRLARELGVGTMTLYGYAESKDALIAMLPDLLLGGLPAPDPEQPWEQMLETVYLAAYRRLMQHGNVVGLIAGTPVFGGAQARIVEGVLECLEGQSFTPAAAFALQRTVGTYTLGFTLFALGESSSSLRPRKTWADAAGTDQFPRTAEVAELLAAPGDEAQYLIGLRSIVAGSRPTTD